MLVVIRNEFNIPKLHKLLVFVKNKYELGKRSSSSKWVYVFADQNPYAGHRTPLKEGQELFRKGLLSEVVLKQKY